MFIYLRNPPQFSFFYNLIDDMNDVTIFKAKMKSRGAA